MIEPRASQPGWAFLVARGRQRGYRTILAPDFVAQRNEQGVLTEGVHGDVTPSGRPRIERVVAPSAGPLTLAYRTHRLTHGDLDGAPGDSNEAGHLGDGELVTDDHGRPLDLLYGFLSRAPHLHHADEADMRTAKDEALRAYRRFLADESGFTIETSQAFPLQSLIASSVAPRPSRGPRQPDRSHEPDTRRQPAASARLWSVAIALVTLGILATAATMWYRSSSSSAGLEAPATAGCELNVESDVLRCSIDVELRATGAADLGSVRTAIERPPGERTAPGVTWTVEPDCRRGEDEDSCTLRVVVTAPIEVEGRDHTATLRIGLEEPNLSVRLRAIRADTLPSSQATTSIESWTRTSVQR